MTGLKYEEQGINLYNILHEQFKKYNNTFDGDINMINYRIVLINSDLNKNKFRKRYRSR